MQYYRKQQYKSEPTVYRSFLKLKYLDEIKNFKWVQVFEYYDNDIRTWYGFEQPAEFMKHIKWKWIPEITEQEAFIEIL